MITWLPVCLMTLQFLIYRFLTNKFVMSFNQLALLPAADVAAATGLSDYFPASKTIGLLRTKYTAAFDQSGQMLCFWEQR